jgi:hypothetical protein
VKLKLRFDRRHIQARHGTAERRRETKTSFLAGFATFLPFTISGLYPGFQKAFLLSACLPCGVLHSQRCIYLVAQCCDSSVWHACCNASLWLVPSGTVQHVSGLRYDNFSCEAHFVMTPSRRHQVAPDSGAIQPAHCNQSMAFRTSSRLTTGRDLNINGDLSAALPATMCGLLSFSTCSR